MATINHKLQKSGGGGLNRRLLFHFQLTVQSMSVTHGSKKDQSASFHWKWMLLFCFNHMLTVNRKLNMNYFVCFPDIISIVCLCLSRNTAPIAITNSCMCKILANKRLLILTL